MSRTASVVVPGFPHHSTQRGNRRADVFESDDDRRAYLRFWTNYSELRGLDSWAYCLLTNHIHLVAVPHTEDALGLAMRDAHTVYAMYFNSRLNLSGHVWQGRFRGTYRRKRAMSDGMRSAAIRPAPTNGKSPQRGGMSPSG